MTDPDSIDKVISSMTDSIRQGLHDMISAMDRASSLLTEARTIAAATDREPEEILYLWAFQALQLGLLTTEEMEKMSLFELLLFLEQTRDAWISAGLVSKLRDNIPEG